MLKNKKVFITGGAGFIASHVIEKIIDNNEVIIFDNLNRDTLGLTNISSHDNFSFIKGDVLDKEHLISSMNGCDVCVHAAAIAGIYSVGNKISHTMKVNLLGVYHALEGAIANNVERFIDFSTSETYGPFVYRGNEDESASIGPVHEKRWIYAVSKLAGEHFAHAYGTDYGLNVVSVRPFNVYGPRQVGEGAIQQMINAAIKGKDITIFNEGTQIRSWCYVQDFADALLATMEVEEAKGQIFNIGNPQATTTVFGLAEAVIRYTNSSSKIVFKPHPGPEVEVRVPDINKAKKILQFKPKIGLEEGLKHSIEWYQRN
jgi:UDP-glucose 4-epimerase